MVLESEDETTLDVPAIVDHPSRPWIVREENADPEPAGVGGLCRSAFVKAFEEKYQCKVAASYMGSSDELVAKLRGGSAANYDVISPSSDVATSIANSGLAAEVDISQIPDYNNLAPQLRDLPLVKVNGKTYGVPFMWGPNPLLYDTTYSKAPPQSWADLWDPKLPERFPFGMISPPFTWRRKCSAMTSPILRICITSLTTNWRR